jgi:hypothetical protein
VFLTPNGKNQSHDSYIGEGSKRGHGKNNFKGGGVGTILMRTLIFMVSIVERMNMRQRHAKSLGRRSNKKNIRKKTKIKY